MRNALSIDLEDWYHPELVRRRIPPDPRPQIVESTGRILALLDRYGVRATFFVLGDVAEKSPDLVRAIRDGWHEIGSHGMSHRPLWELSPREFDAELKAFDRLIREILGEGVAIRGFRAPTFSLDDRTRFALRCLVENGYRYDSSVFPARNYLYGVAGAPCAIYEPGLDDLRDADGGSGLVEFPMTVFEWGRFRIPVSGGLYLRVFPYAVLRRLLGRINKARPFVIYVHPWETFPGTPRVKSVGLLNGFITYYGIDGCLRKIERLLRDFEFGPMAEVIGSRVS